MAVDTPQRRAVAALALGLLAAAVFWPIREHAFLDYDDDVYVTANPPVANGLAWDGVAWAFTTFQGANWFPLTRLSWMLDAELHGMDAKGFHTTSLLLHALSTAVLFLALTRLSGAPGKSAFVAAVFAVHPLHVESVAWVSTRKDTLSGLFFNLALLAYVPSRGGAPPRGRLAVVSVCLALGLLAKQMLVTLPFVLLLLDDWPLGRLRRRDGSGRLDSTAVRSALAEKLPLFALVAAFSLVALLAQRAGGALAGLEDVSLPARLANAAVAAVAYLAKAFVPTRLAVFYPHPTDGLPLWRVAAATALLIGLSALALRSARRPSPLAVGWFWYLGTLVPVIGIVQVGSQAMADRYTYLPLIGISIAVAWGVCGWLERTLPAPHARPTLLASLACGCVAALWIATHFQLRHWRDSETLMRHALAVTEENHQAHAYLGRALLAQHEVEEAASHWRAALRIRPGYLEVANNLAWLLATAPDARQRRPAEAVAVAERAAQLAPDDPAVIDTLAAAYAAEGRFAPAVATAERALALAKASARDELIPALGRRLGLYRRGVAYVDR